MKGENDSLMNIRTFADLETEIDHLRGELWEKKQLITELEQEIRRLKGE